MRSLLTFGLIFPLPIPAGRKYFNSERVEGIVLPFTVTEATGATLEMANMVAQYVMSAGEGDSWQVISLSAE